MTRRRAGRLSLAAGVATPFPAAAATAAAAVTQDVPSVGAAKLPPLAAVSYDGGGGSGGRSRRAQTRTDTKLPPLGGGGGGGGDARVSRRLPAYSPPPANKGASPSPPVPLSTALRRGRYFHTTSLAPVVLPLPLSTAAAATAAAADAPAESGLEPDSEDELDEAWMTAMDAARLGRLPAPTSDVLFMALWNGHVAAAPPWGDRHVGATLASFVAARRGALTTAALWPQLVAHVGMLYEYGLVDAAAAAAAVGALATPPPSPSSSPVATGNPTAASTAASAMDGSTAVASGAKSRRQGGGGGGGGGGAERSALDPVEAITVAAAAEAEAALAAADMAARGDQPVRSRREADRRPLSGRRRKRLRW
ncbi:hypothetical protein MMPV_006510 [Pyropia vietnamensis]